MGRGAHSGTPPALDRKLTVIRGQVYDITDFLDKHPGGREVINLAVGRDATILFEMSHIRSEVTEKWLKSVPKVEGVSLTDLAQQLAGPFDAPCGDPKYITAEGAQVESIKEEFATPGESELYQVLKKRVREEVMAKKGMPSARGFNSINTICVLAYYAFASYLYLCCPSFLSAIALGLAGAWVGFGLQHTANHGGLTQLTWLNQILGLGDDIGCGGSSLVWRYHHQVSHHVYTNVLDADMDVYSSAPFIRFDDRQEKMWFHQYQWIYAPISFCFLYWSIQFQDFLSVREKKIQDVRMLGLTNHEVRAFWGGKAVHFMLAIIIPLLTQPFWAAIFYYLVYTSVGSAVLSWFFIVSHNIEEVKPTAIPKEAKDDWAVWQIRTSATWGGRFAGFMTGGLNYQIEHHLFPAMSHNIYPDIQPIIEDECAKRNIPYAKYDLMDISKAMVDFLHQMGTKETVPMEKKTL